MIGKLEHSLQKTRIKLSVAHRDNADLKRKIDELRQDKLMHITILHDLVSLIERYLEKSTIVYTIPIMSSFFNILLAFHPYTSATWIRRNDGAHEAEPPGYHDRERQEAQDRGGDLEPQASNVQGHGALLSRTGWYLPTYLPTYQTYITNYCRPSVSYSVW